MMSESNLTDEKIIKPEPSAEEQPKKRQVIIESLILFGYSPYFSFDDICTDILEKKLLDLYGQEVKKVGDMYIVINVNNKKIHSITVNHFSASAESEKKLRDGLIDDINSDLYRLQGCHINPAEFNSFSTEVLALWVDFFRKIKKEPTSHIGNFWKNLFNKILRNK